MTIDTGQLYATLLGGFISAGVAFITLRSTLGNQLSLEERKFEYQQQLEREKRDHELSAFRRTVLRELRRLHNTSSMHPERRIPVQAWKRATVVLKALLESDSCSKALDDARYDAVWRACDESEAAIMFLELWATHLPKSTPDVALLSLREYNEALEACFTAFGDAGRAREVRQAQLAGFKGVGFWMTGDFEEDAVYPNP